MIAADSPARRVAAPTPAASSNVDSFSAEPLIEFLLPAETP